MCAICTVVIVEEFLYVILNVACRKIIFISVPEVLCMGANPMGLKKKIRVMKCFHVHCVTYKIISYVHFVISIKIVQACMCAH